MDDAPDARIEQVGAPRSAPLRGNLVPAQIMRDDSGLKDMCGRGDQSMTWADIYDGMDLYRADTPDNMRPSYNVAPTHDVLVCGLREGRREVRRMRWGLIPVWAKEKPKFATINARCETLEDRTTWKGSLNRMRCVVPFNGYFEWRLEKGKKQPYYVKRRDGELMFIAGLWAYNDKIDPDGIRSFTIVTTIANKTMGLLHHRMPVILHREDIDLWIGPKPWGDDLRALCKPCPDDWLTAYPVSTEVNSVKNNQPNLVDPVGEPLF